MAGSRYVKSLDGVRGVAILAVMAFHFTVELVPGGALGVDIFFALSGFLISGLLLDELSTSGRIDFVSFYLRRAGRLLPALLVFLLMVAPVVANVLHAPNVVTNSVKTLFYVSNFAAADVWLGPLGEPFNHTWSLATEEQFYLVWPILITLAVAAKIRLTTALSAALVAALALSWAAEAILGIGTNYFLPTGHVWALVAGALAACLVRDERAARVVARLGGGAAAAASWLLLGLLVLAPRASWPVALQSVVIVPASVALVSVLLHCMAARATLLTRVLQTPVLVWFGQRSYGLYLFHTALYYVFAPPTVALSRSLNILVAVGLSLMITEVSYRWIETPARRWARSYDDARRVRRGTARQTNPPVAS